MRFFSLGALALLLVLAGCGSYLKPDGTFEVKTKAQLMGTESSDPEFGMLVDFPKITVYFAPLDDSKVRGELNRDQRVTILGYVVRDGQTTDWVLVGAEGMEGYVRAPNVDPIVREGVDVALVPLEGSGEPLFAKALLERHYLLADGTLVTREGAISLDLPPPLETDNRVVVVEGDTVFAKLFDFSSGVDLKPGTRAVFLGQVRTDDSRAALKSYDQPVLIRTGEGQVAFLPLSALLIHPVEATEGTVGARVIYRYKPDDPYRGHYSRLECWDNGALVSEGLVVPGDIESIRKTENNPGAEWVVERRFTAPTLSSPFQYEEAEAEALVEDWYHHEPDSEFPWGQQVFRQPISLAFSAWDGEVQETHKLTLSPLGEGFSDRHLELRGNYQLTTWRVAPPSEPEYHESEEGGEDGGEGEDFNNADYGDPGPPSGSVDVEASLSFTATVSYDEDGYALGPQGAYSDADLPEEWRTGSVDGLHSMIARALARALNDDDVAEEIFPAWYH